MTVEGTWPPIRKRAAQHVGVTRRTRLLGRRIWGRVVNPLQAVIPHQDLPFCSACEGPVSTAPHLTCGLQPPSQPCTAPRRGQGVRTLPEAISFLLFPVGTDLS